MDDEVDNSDYFKFIQLSKNDFPLIDACEKCKTIFYDDVQKFSYCLKRLGDWNHQFVWCYRCCKDEYYESVIDSFNQIRYKGDRICDQCDKNMTEWEAIYTDYPYASYKESEITRLCLKCVKRNYDVINQKCWILKK